MPVVYTLSYKVAQTVTFRPKSSRTVSRLEQRAKATGIPKTVLANRYVEEGLKMDAHPGIVFRDGPAGRRAGVVGGPDVWEVIEVLKDNRGSLKATAQYLGLRPGLVASAASYYAENRDEIDDWIKENRRLLAAAEVAFRRRQSIAKRA